MIRVADIKEEVLEVIGNGTDTVLYRTLTQAVKLLATSGLFDPQIGYMDFFANSNHTIALPRDVKTPLKININSNPAFHHSRMFEFAQNTDGTVLGDEIGWSWANRGYAYIQDETKLPTRFKYVCTDVEDEGKTVTVTGTGEDGRVITRTLTADQNYADATETDAPFVTITRVVREETEGECRLETNDGSDQVVLARYYADELRPEYRVIKLSQTEKSIRMMYRKHVYKVTSDEDILPVHSEMAVILMASSVRKRMLNETQLADAQEQSAIRMLKMEQDSRDEGGTISEATEVVPTTDRNINTLGILIVGDVYDDASEIFGPVGRPALFDEISLAIETLGNKALWDSMIGTVDVWKPNRENIVNPIGADTGDGIFVLPRYVGTPLAVNFDGRPGFARNRWFEFHINAEPQETVKSAYRTWDDMGETCIIDTLRLDPDTKKVIPVRLVAICEVEADAGTEVKVYGIERLEDGTEVEVYRNGAPGFVIPCLFDDNDPKYPDSNDEPLWIRIDRITKGSSQGFIKLWTSEISEIKYDEDAPAEGTIQSVLGNDKLQYKTITAGRITTLIPGDYVQLPLTDFTTEFAIVDSITFVNDAGDGLVYEVILKNGGVQNGEIRNGFGIEVTVITWETDILLGYWYPDELEPRYRVIKLPSHQEKRVRVRYRKHTRKFSGFHEPIFLNCRGAVIDMMRAIKEKSKGNFDASEAYEALAVRQLKEEQAVKNPHGGPTLQFNPGTSPGSNENIL